MRDRPVRHENERGGLEMRPPVMRAGVAPDEHRDSFGIHARDHFELEAELLDGRTRIRRVVGRDRDDPRTVRAEFGVMLLEVGQLPTAVGSPMAAVEQEDSRRAVQVRRNGDSAAIDRVGT